MGTDDEVNTLGTAIRRARIEQGLSLRRLAQELHIGASTLSDYEQDRRLPSQELLTSCEKKLDLHAGDLISLRRAALAARAAHLLPSGSAANAVDGSDASAPESPPDATAPTSPDAGPDRSESPVRTSRLHRWSSSLVTAGVGAIIALAIQDLPPLLHHSGASPHRNAAPSRSAVPPHALPKDDGDPHDSGCDADGVTLSVADLNVYRPGRVVIGQTVARYSPACKTIWPRFEPTAALDRIAPHARVTLLALRPADHRHVTYSAAYEGVFAWGNMLLTTTGCVATTVTVTGPGLRTPVTASTPCMTGTAHS